MAREKIDALTGLRGIAALWVALFHGVTPLRIDPGFPAAVINVIACGWIAVDLFFVLSGYVISHVHADDFVRISGTEYARFLKLRIARIYPTHLVIALLWVPLIAAATLLLPGSVTPGVAQSFNWKTFLYAVTLLNGWGIPGSQGWNLPSWSVGSEWFAYLTFPVLAVASNRIRSASTFVAIGVATMAIVLLLSFAIRGGSQFMLPEQFTLVRVESEFLLGVCVYGIARAYSRGRVFDALSATTLVAIVWLSALGSFGLAVAGLIGCFALLVLGLARSAWLGQWLLGSKALVYLGEISYSLYLVHGIVILMLRTGIRHVGMVAQDGPLWATVRLVTYLGAAVVAGHLAYAFVEDPCRRYLRRRWRTDVRPPPAT